MRFATGVRAAAKTRQQHDSGTTTSLTTSTEPGLTARSSTDTDQLAVVIHTIHRFDNDHQTGQAEGRSTNRAGIPMPPARLSANLKPELGEVEPPIFRLIEYRTGLRHAA